MRDAPGLWLVLLALAAGSGITPARNDSAGSGQGDDLLALLEFLGDEETASDAWNGFFDSLPERPEDFAPPATGPVAAEEAQP